jgi:coenzyme PQQ precursor peptide PqqA
LGSLAPAATSRPWVRRDFEAAPPSLIEKSDNKFGNPEQESNRVHPYVHPTERRNVMAWKTPRIVEIAVGMEINTYACADL